MLAIVLLPALSWLDGSGQLAWTMFSRTGTYRIEVLVLANDGRARAVAPTGLAVRAGGAAATYLAGADNWRHHDVARITLRRHLAEVARLGCAELPRPAAVEITLFERADLDAPVRTTSARVPCAVP